MFYETSHKSLTLFVNLYSAPKTADQRGTDPESILNITLVIN